MNKPTKYQRWWMNEMADNNSSLVWLLDDCGDHQIREWHLGHALLGRSKAISKHSVRVSRLKGWTIEIISGETILTPAGLKALETT